MVICLERGIQVAALLRVEELTAGLAESTGSPNRRVYEFYDSRHLTAKNRDQLKNPTLGYRVWATFTF